MPESPGARILVFGDVIDDIVVVPEGEIRVDTDTPAAILRRAGGSAANVASWLGATGVAVEFIGRVGAADLERHARLLRDAGVAPRLIADGEHPTGAIVVVVSGDRRTMLTEKGANAFLGPDDITDEMLAGVDLVHFTGYSLFGRSDRDAAARLIRRVTLRGGRVSVDPASAGFLADFGAEAFLEAVRGAHFVFPNLDEGALLTGLSDPVDIAARLAERFPVVALTLGSGGAIVAQAGADPLVIEAAVTPTVDPTGAGDAFCAGFLAEWLANGDAVRAGMAGARLAARAVSVMGGRPVG